MNLTIDKISIEDCYAILKPYQQRIIKELVTKYGEEGAAERWINSKGAGNTVTFGGLQQENPQQDDYWSRLKVEFDKFLCGHPDYEVEREKLVGTGKAIGLASVAGISSWLGPLIGVSPVLLVPSIALLLTTTSKMGINAYCSVKTFE